VLDGFVWPNAAVDFSDVDFFEQEHAESALAYAAADGEG